MNRLHCSWLLRLGAGNGSVFGMIGDRKFGRLAAARAPFSAADERNVLVNTVTHTEVHLEHR